MTIDTDPITADTAGQVHVTATRTDASGDAAVVSVRLCDNSGQHCTAWQSDAASSAGSPLTFDASSLSDGKVTATATFTDGAHNSSTASDSARKGTLLGDWTFASGEPVETTGWWSTFELHGNAAFDDGQLVVAGIGNGDNAATAWAHAAGYSGPDIASKTMVSWVKLDDAEVRSGSPIAIYDHTRGDTFDAVDYAESTAHQWMQGSAGGFRNQPFVPGSVDTDTTHVRQIAISYQNDGRGGQTITGCLNGTQLGSYTTGASPLWDQNSQALFGPRHRSGPQEVPVGSIAAHISESRIYGEALSCAQVVALTPAPRRTVSFVTAPVNAANQHAVDVDVASDGFEAVTATVMICNQNGDPDSGPCGSPGTVTFAAGDTTAQRVTLDSDPVGDGPITVVATFSNAARRSTTTMDTATKDTTGPSVSATINPDPITASDQAAVHVTGNANDNAATTIVAYLTDGTTKTDTQTVTIPAPGPAPAPGGGSYDLTFDATALNDGPVTAVVTGTDVVGNSTEVSETATKATTTVPGLAQNVTAQQTGPGQVTVTWEPPIDDGGSPITEYGVGYGNGGNGNGGPQPATARSAVFDGLRDGQYTASVHAVNARGDGDAIPVPFTIVTAEAPAPAGVAESQSPSPSPSSSLPLRRPLTLSALTPIIDAGKTSALVATGEPNAQYELRCYTRPSTTYVTSHPGRFNDAGDAVVITLSLGRNTRCFIQYATNPAQGASASVVVKVRAVLSLSTVRTGPRTFVFQGRNLPRVAGQLITLYRVDGRGQEIRTSNVMTDDTGTYRISREFTGSGTYAFRVRTSENLNNLAGASNTITVSIG